jgi:hypothetical protein
VEYYLAKPSRVSDFAFWSNFLSGLRAEKGPKIPEAAENSGSHVSIMNNLVLPRNT